MINTTSYGATSQASAHFNIVGTLTVGGGDNGIRNHRRSTHTRHHLPQAPQQPSRVARGLHHALAPCQHRDRDQGHRPRQGLVADRRDAPQDAGEGDGNGAGEVELINMIAGLMFNYGLLGAMLCLMITLIGFVLGGRVA